MVACFQFQSETIYNVAIKKNWFYSMTQDFHEPYLGEKTGKSLQYDLTFNSSVRVFY